MKKTHLSTRDELVIGLLKAELTGPQVSPDIPQDSLYHLSLPKIKPLAIKAGQASLASREEIAAMFIESGSGEEILKLNPLARYGCGILYPRDVVQEEISTDENDDTTESSEPAEPATEINRSDKEQESGGEISSDDPDFDVSLTNARLPSSMAVSFVVDSHCCRLAINFTGATYQKFRLNVDDTTRDWWFRKPFKVQGNTPFDQGAANASFIVSGEQLLIEGGVSPDLFDLRVITRPVKHSDKTLVTVAVTNRAATSTTENALFQTELVISALSEDKKGCIAPYPENDLTQQDDPELASFELLYRNDQTFAIGHGCAADWPSSDSSGNHRVTEVFTQSIPAYETASITPDIITASGDALTVSMEALASFEADDHNTGVKQLNQLISEYRNWITLKESHIPGLATDKLKQTAKRHLESCRECLERMQAGLNLLCGKGTASESAKEAFRLANKAMLVQQKHAIREPRQSIFRSGKLSFEIPFAENTNAKGQWRAFQIGFLLMSLTACVNNDDPFREAVDLIWFPTGGGKTEAYLGLAAFTMFFQRLVTADSTGVQVLMRYTLRLLTTQQFTRAATLICAMESIRKNRNDLGNKAFSIGL